MATPIGSEMAIVTRVGRHDPFRRRRLPSTVHGHLVATTTDLPNNEDSHPELTGSGMLIRRLAIYQQRQYGLTVRCVSPMWTMLRVAVADLQLQGMTTPS